MSFTKAYKPKLINHLMGKNLKRIASAFLLAGVLSVCGLPMFAQTHVVKGSVLDAAGEPIIGANVIVAGDASVGTFTDLDGAFTLETPSKDAVLAVSCIGFATTEVALNGRTTIEITMQPDMELHVWLHCNFNGGSAVKCNFSSCKSDA